MPERNVHSSAQAMTASSGKSGRVKASSCGPSIPVKRHAAGFARVEPEGAQPRGGAGQRDGVPHPREQKKARWEAAARHAGYTGKCAGSWCSSPFLFRWRWKAEGSRHSMTSVHQQGRGDARQTAHARKGGNGHAAGIVPSGTRHIQPRRRTRLYPPDQHAHR